MELKLKQQRCRLATGPLRSSDTSERSSGNQMALDVEGVVDGCVGREETVALIEPNRIVACVVTAFGLAGEGSLLGSSSCHQGHGAWQDPDPSGQHHKMAVCL